MCDFEHKTQGKLLIIVRANVRSAHNGCHIFIPLLLEDYMSLKQAKLAYVPINSFHQKHKRRCFDLLPICQDGAIGRFFRCSRRVCGSTKTNDHHAYPNCRYPY